MGCSLKWLVIVLFVLLPPGNCLRFLETHESRFKGLQSKVTGYCIVCTSSAWELSPPFWKHMKIEPEPERKEKGYLGGCSLNCIVCTSSGREAIRLDFLNRVWLLWLLSTKNEKRPTSDEKPQMERGQKVSIRLIFQTPPFSTAIRMGQKLGNLVLSVFLPQKTLIEQTKFLYLADRNLLIGFLE